MSITHSHIDGGMTEHLLQGQDVSAIHDEVAGEGMTEGMGCLAFG